MRFSRWKMLGITVVALAILAGSGSLWVQQRIASRFDRLGGTRLVLEPDFDGVAKDRLIQIRDNARHVLEEAGLHFSDMLVKREFVELKVQDADRPAAMIRLRDLHGTSGTTDANSVNRLEVAEAGGVIRLSMPQDVIAEQRLRVVEQSVEAVRRRVREFGVGGVIVERQGSESIVVKVPEFADRMGLKNLLDFVGKVELRMVDASVSADQVSRAEVPRDCEVLMSASMPDRRFAVKKQVSIAGSDVVDAQAGLGYLNNEPIVSITFSSSGAQRFAQLTKENIGAPFAIVVDNAVISAPVIREPITGGKAEISGQFTTESARAFAIVLRAGALPARLMTLEERAVGPGGAMDQGFTR